MDVFVKCLDGSWITIEVGEYSTHDDIINIINSKTKYCYCIDNLSKEDKNTLPQCLSEIKLIPRTYETELNILECNNKLNLESFIKNEDINMLDAYLSVFDINSQNKEGNTILLYSIIFKNINITKSLLQKDDLDINISNLDGDNSLTLASISGNIEIIKLLLKRDDLNLDHKNNKGNNAFFESLKNKHIEVIKLLAPISDVNIIDNNGNTPIIYSIINKDLNMVELLLNNSNIDIYKQDCTRTTPLQWAKKIRNRNIIMMINTYISKSN